MVGRGVLALLRYFAVAGVLANPAPTYAESRLALIVTNAAYSVEIGALANPHRDGEVIATGLQAVGFEKNNIVIVRDADQPTLRMAIADFVERIEKAGREGHDHAIELAFWHETLGRVLQPLGECHVSAGIDDDEAGLRRRAL